MILNKIANKNEWRVTNKKHSPKQNWADGIVTKNSEFNCTCEQFKKYGKNLKSCTHIKQVKEYLSQTK